MTDMARRLLEALPVGAWRPLRWAAHKSEIPHCHAIGVAKDLIGAGLLEARRDNWGEWQTGSILVRRVVLHQSERNGTG